jgi:indolepyruvate ferredoxin oxidoreductase beta subunit
MMKYCDILVTGVGGQGIITFGRVLSSVYNKRGVRVMMAETHGMSQRGGSVEVHIRIGDIHSPLVPVGGADVIIGLELIETMRVLRYANKDTIVVANTRMIRPALPKINMPSPDELISKAESLGIKILTVNAHELALKAGSALSVNMVMLGGLVALDILPGKVTKKDFLDVISGLRMSEINSKAFEMGYDAVKTIL